MENKYLSLISYLLMIIFYGIYNYTILFDYAKIPFPEIDRGQYIEGWPAGWGAKEIMETARERSHKKPVTILAEGNFGMAGDVLDIFTQPNDRIFIKSYWPLDHSSYEESKKELRDHFVFVVLPYQSDYPQDGSVRLIRRFEKTGGKTAITFLEMIK